MKFLGLYRSEGFHYREGLWTKLAKMASSPWGNSFTKEETEGYKNEPSVCSFACRAGRNRNFCWVHFNTIPKGHADGIIYWNIHEKQMKTNLD